jgi:hypothetical protein
MPYYVFSFGPLGIPEKLAEAQTYREAKARLRELREQAEAAAAGSGITQARRTMAAPASEPPLIRMIFATNEIEAADLLTQPRAPDASAYGADD